MVKRTEGEPVNKQEQMDNDPIIKAFEEKYPGWYAPIPEKIRIAKYILETYAPDKLAEYERAKIET